MGHSSTVGDITFLLDLRSNGLNNIIQYEAMSVENKAKIEPMNYQEDQAKDMKSLAKYLLIYDLFVQCDTDLPSS